MDAGLDSNPKICAAGRAGREVFLFLLRRNALLDADGELPISNVLPEYLARQLDMPVTEARDAVVTLRDVSLIVVTESTVRFLGWSEEWRGPKSEAERAAQYRARKHEKQPNHAEPDTLVTPRHASSRDVTKSHRLRVEENRVEESRERDIPASPALPLGDGTGVGIKAAPLARKALMPTGWEPDESCRRRAAELRLDLDAEVSEFRDWTTAKRMLYADWQAAFRSHLSSQAKRRPSSANGTIPLKVFGSTVGKPFVSTMDKPRNGTS